MKKKKTAHQGSTQNKGVCKGGASPPVGKTHYGSDTKK